MEEALPGSLPRHAGLYSLYSLDSLESLDSLDTFTSFTDKQIRSNEQLDARVARVLLVFDNAVKFCQVGFGLLRCSRWLS